MRLFTFCRIESIRVCPSLSLSHYLSGRHTRPARCSLVGSTWSFRRIWRLCWRHFSRIRLPTNQIRRRQRVRKISNGVSFGRESSSRWQTTPVVYSSADVKLHVVSAPLCGLSVGQSSRSVRTTPRWRRRRKWTLIKFGLVQLYNSCQVCTVESDVYLSIMSKTWGLWSMKNN